MINLLKLWFHSEKDITRRFGRLIEGSNPSGTTSFKRKNINFLGYTDTDETVKRQNRARVNLMMTNNEISI